MNTETKDDISEIRIYADGSGNALEEEKQNLRSISETEFQCGTLRAFIAKHRNTLAGMSWRISVSEPPEIEIAGCYRYYRGKQITAEQVASLFPEAEWQRTMHKYHYEGREDDGRRDWIADFDGVRLRIENAECHKIVKQKFPSSGKIRLPKSGASLPLLASTSH